MSLTLATFNVCGLPPALSGLAPLSTRAVGFCRAFERSDVDVVNFQEVLSRRQLAALRRLLPSYPHAAWVQTPAGAARGGLVTFARRPLGRPVFTSFDGVAPTAGGAAFRATRRAKGSRQGVLAVPLGGSATVVANTHLTANKDGDWSEGNRYHAFHRAQLRVVHAAVRAARTPGAELVLLSGDFNIASGSTLYPFVVDSGASDQPAWRDPFAASDPVTFHLPFLPPGSTAHRIDYLLVSGDPARFPVLDHRTLFAEPLVPSLARRGYASDHIGLMARIGA